MESSPIHLGFDGGTILVSSGPAEVLVTLPGCRFDTRTNSYRAEARDYRALVEHLRQTQLSYTDAARAYQPVSWPLQAFRDPFPHQTEALDAWWSKGGRGVVVLP